MRNWTAGKPHSKGQKLHDAPAAACDRKLTLLDLYNAMVNRQAEVTNRLGTWAWDHGRFQKILKEWDDARKDCEKAKCALKLHCDEHGC